MEKMNMRGMAKNSLANYITLFNIVFGCLSLLCTLDGRLELSAVFILLAVLMDTTDGRVARKLDIISELGRELDSLCDLVSFGVAPAFLTYALLPASYQTPGAILAVLYIVCGAYRLARFNVLRIDDYFVGVPITLAGLLLALLALCYPFIPSLVLLLMLPLLAFFMVSNIRVKKISR